MRQKVLSWHAYICFFVTCFTPSIKYLWYMFKAKARVTCRNTGYMHQSSMSHGEKTLSEPLNCLNKKKSLLSNSMREKCSDNQTDFLWLLFPLAAEKFHLSVRVLTCFSQFWLLAMPFLIYFFEDSCWTVNYVRIVHHPKIEYGNKLRDGDSL